MEPPPGGVEAINEGFVLYDAEDRLVLCNTKYREIYALSAAAMVPGVRFEDLLKFGIARGQYQDAKADPEGWLKARLDRRKADAEPFEQELGNGRWLMVSDRRTSDGGRVGIRTDITDLKRNVAELTNAQQDLAAQAERMRKLAEAADEASRAKTGFMAMISHEIRTPLNAVLGLGNLLAETRLDDRQRTFVAGIDDAGTHLLALINNILDYSRFESGKDNGTPVPTKLRELVDGVARMIGVLASEKRIAFSVDIQEGLPEWLMLDPAFLKQVLINLLGNAVNFTQAGGVQLAVSAMDVGEDRIQLRMTITDSGIGIPEAMQERIFEPFERSTLPDGRTSGAGLGLAISRRLVTAMGGQIRLAKSDTSGTTFVVELPAQLCGETPEKASTVNTGVPDASQQTIAAARPLAILVAEDTPASQLVIQAMLEHRGHRVTLVSDGGAALEAAGRQDFDLIILDIQMPRMYGYDVVAGIRKLPGARGKVPVAALTAQAFDEDRKRALAAGFDFHLSKPIRQAELASLLERAAARTAAMTAAAGRRCRHIRRTRSPAGTRAGMRAGDVPDVAPDGDRQHRTGTAGLTSGRGGERSWRSAAIRAQAVRASWPVWQFAGHDGSGFGRKCFVRYSCGAACLAPRRDHADAPVSARQAGRLIGEVRLTRFERRQDKWGDRCQNLRRY